MKRRAICWALLLLWPLLLLARAESPFPCRVVLEQAEGVTAERWVAEVSPGEAAVFELRVDAAYTVTGADYDGATLTRRPDGGWTLTLPDVRYSEAVRLNLTRNDVHLTYHANGGIRLDGGDPTQSVSLPAAPTHLRLNTSLGTDLFSREGCILTGWNSAPDGSGLAVGLGSRVEPMEGLTLYAQWASWAAPALFRWEPYADGVTITAYLGQTTPAAPPGGVSSSGTGGSQPALPSNPADSMSAKSIPAAPSGGASSSGTGEPQPSLPSNPADGVTAEILPAAPSGGAVSSGAWKPRPSAPSNPADSMSAKSIPAAPSGGASSSGTGEPQPSLPSIPADGVTAEIPPAAPSGGAVSSGAWKPQPALPSNPADSMSAKSIPAAPSGGASSSGKVEPQPSMSSISADGVNGTAYSGEASVLAIPAELGGLPVRGISAGAFAGADCEAVVLPKGLWSVADGAFDGSNLSTLVLFDSIREISDYAFTNCPNLRTLRVNAALPPVYSGAYFAAFADKFDRLWALRDARKLVLFSGSSARFGYDSAALDAAFPEFEVVNMGVFAYTNALPQFELIRGCMSAGDVLLHSPEFDAIQRQFCVTNRLDAPFFNMMEANYDMLARLDLREYGQVFTAFHAYLKSREGMEPRSYDLSPADFDEDGNPVAAPSYNDYGDYILYRPNASDSAPIYGLPVDYTPAGYPKSFLDSANAEYARFQAMGVRVYVTYAPRNRLAISESSTPEARAALDACLREGLCAPVISDIEDSLVSGTYLYGTDNHLSTEGVALRTAQIIEDLRAQFQREGASTHAEE